MDRRTGLWAEATDSKSQEANREAAFIKLALKIITQCKAQRMNPVLMEAQATGWGGPYRRTYKPMQSFVLDHKTDRKYPYDPIMDGELARIHRDMGLVE